MADPSQMTDDELNKVIETGIVPEEPTSEPAEVPEEPVAEVEEPEAPAEEAPQEEDPKEVPEVQPPSRREQLRIQTLLAKYGNPAERSPQQAPSQPTNALDYATALDTDPEIVQQLEADRKAVAQQAFTQGREEATQALAYTQFYNNIRFDLPLVSEKLSKLDPLDAQSIDQEYMAITGADPTRSYVRNPNIGYAEFVEARLEQAERLARSMTAQTTKNIAKQAATTGLRPDGSSAKRLNLNQAPEHMTLEELYASIGQTQPKTK